MVSPYIPCHQCLWKILSAWTHSLVLGPYLDLHFPELHHSIVVEHTAFWALLDLLASALQDTTFFCWFLQRSFELHGVPNSELLSSHSRTWVPFLGIVWSYLDIDAETVSPMHFNFKLFLSSLIRTTTFFSDLSFEILPTSFFLPWYQTQ